MAHKVSTSTCTQHDKPKSNNEPTMNRLGDIAAESGRIPKGVFVNVNVNNLLAISRLDFDNSGEPGPQAKGEIYAQC